MGEAMSGASIAAVAIGMICPPLAVVVLVFLPTQRRDKRLKLYGVEAEAVCTERIRTGDSGVRYVRCHYRMESGAKIAVMINSPQPAPELGHSFRIVYNPQKPSEAASAQYMASGATKHAYVLQVALAVLVTTAVLLVTVFS